MNLNYKEFINLLYSLEILKYIEDGRMGGSHWTCFIVKDIKLFYFDSFGETPDNFLLNRLTKPIIYHIYKKQDKSCHVCESYCLYFFYLIERMNYYDTILNLVLE